MGIGAMNGGDAGMVVPWGSSGSSSPTLTDSSTNPESIPNATPKILLPILGIPGCELIGKAVQIICSKFEAMSAEAEGRIHRETTLHLL